MSMKTQLAAEAKRIQNSSSRTTDGTNGQDGDARQRRDSAATELVKLAEAAGVELFHTPGADPDGFATILTDTHKQTCRIGTKWFRHWLQRLFWIANKSAVNNQAMQDAIGVLRGKALFEGPEKTVAVRLAEFDNAIWLNLANERWQAVRIDKGGWEVVDNPPVCFIRPRGVLALPTPTRGGSLDELRSLVNLAGRADWLLMLSWLIAAYRPRGPYPVLAIHGEQGSAKSTACRLLRALVDPNEAPLRSEPRNERDLMIAASNGWTVAFENLSSIPVWLSDALCRLSTGGGFSTRELYSDGEEKLFNAMRPVLLNGINELATRSDLLDRTIVLTLPTIPDHRRRTEAELTNDFVAAQPRILGALLEAVSAALRNVDDVRLDEKPRMADFAVWATAAETSLGFEPGAFVAAYAGNRATLNETAIESCIISEPLLALVGDGGSWEGTATELLKALEDRAGERTTHRKDWPKRPNVLSGYLRRISPNLRQMGIETEFDRKGDTGRKRLIRITRKTIVHTVQSVQSSTDDRPAERPSSIPSSAQHPENPVENSSVDDVDAVDDESDNRSDEYLPGMDYPKWVSQGEDLF